MAPAGRERAAAMIVDCAHYRGGVRQHERAMSPEEAAALIGGEQHDFVWIGLLDPTDEEMAEVADMFNLHELAVEDAEGAHQRPKLEDYDDSFFIVLKTAHYHEDTETVHFGEIDLFIGRDYLVSVRPGPGAALRGARKRLEDRPDLLKLGPAAVVWAIVDQVVDDYLPVTEGIDDDIEEVEAAVF